MPKNLEISVKIQNFYEILEKTNVGREGGKRRSDGAGGSKGRGVEGEEK